MRAIRFYLIVGLLIGTVLIILGIATGESIRWETFDKYYSMTNVLIAIGFMELLKRKDKEL